MSNPYPSTALGATHRSGSHRRPSEAIKCRDGSDPAPEYPTASDGLGSPRELLPYLDVVGVWLRDPLGPNDLAYLQSLCGGKLGHRVRKPRFRRNDRPEREYRQRLTLRQPSRTALEYLAQRNDVLFNYDELALDWIYDSREELDAALQFVIEHGLKKDRRNAEAKICLGKKGPTIYSGARWTPNLAVTYADKKSKVSGAPHSLHTERRTAGAQALERNGRRSLRDLLALDQLQFWRDHLQFYRIHDVEGLGRAYLNAIARQENPQGIARRKAKIIKVGNSTYNEDKRMGHQLIRTLGLFTDEQIAIRRNAKQRDKTQYPGYWSIYGTRSIQNVYDRLNHLIRMDRFISPISVDANFNLRCLIRQGESA
jgi:hypothetical protein